MIEYNNFQKSLKNLETQFENYKTLDDNLPKIIQEAVAESVIQRFEICWDCLWKILKRHLQEEIGLPTVPNGPNPVLRLANENQLLPGSVEQWLRYGKLRVATAHDYSSKKANDALNIMSDFIGDAIRLYQGISGKNWGSNGNSAG